MTAQPVIPGFRGYFVLGSMDAFNEGTLNFLLQLRPKFGLQMVVKTR